MKQVKISIDNAEALAQKHESLIELRGNITQAISNVDQFDQLLGQTRTKIQNVSAYRNESDEAAAGFMKNCEEYLNSQNAALIQEILNGASK